ncbi:hypothetical protein M1N24_02925 [Dehalococcoidia bacterium]|nr:hypothetical protein [Dehalococcoidia bacterium]
MGFETLIPCLQSLADSIFRIMNRQRVCRRAGSVVQWDGFISSDAASRYGEER